MALSIRGSSFCGSGAEFFPTNPLVLARIFGEDAAPSRGASGLAPEKVNCRSKDVLVRDKAVYKAHRESFRRGDRAARREDLQGAAAADDARQAPSSAPARENAERTAGVREDGLFARNSNMASEREIEAAAQAVASDGGDHRLRKLLDPVHHSLSETGKLEGFGGPERGKFRDFGPGGECQRRAGNHNAGARRFACKGIEITAQGIK